MLKYMKKSPWWLESASHNLKRIQHQISCTHAIVLTEKVQRFQARGIKNDSKISSVILSSLFARVQLNLNIQLCKGQSQWIRVWLSTDPLWLRCTDFHIKMSLRPSCHCCIVYINTGLSSDNSFLSYTCFLSLNIVLSLHFPSLSKTSFLPHRHIAPTCSPPPPKLVSLSVLSNPSTFVWPPHTQWGG